MKTNKDYTIEDFMGHGKLVIPAGSRVSHQTACDIDYNYHFLVDKLPVDPNSLLAHDLKYHGINIPREYVDYTVIEGMAEFERQSVGGKSNAIYGKYFIIADTTDGDDHLKVPVKFYTIKELLTACQVCEKWDYRIEGNEFILFSR